MSLTSAAGRRIKSLFISPRRLLITILLGNLLVNIVSTSAVTSAALKIFGERGIGYAFITMSILILAVGEIFPKVTALARAEFFSRIVIFPLSVIHTAFYPIRLPLSIFADSVIESIKSRLGYVKKYFSSEELITAVDMGVKEGNFDKFEHSILSNILAFRKKQVKEIMTPTVNVFSLPVEMGREEMIAEIRRSGFSRVPVHGRSKDDIKGFLHIKDLLKTALHEEKRRTNLPLRKTFFVPETAHIAELLKEFIKSRMHFAVVIDEYGSYVGIATMEDILEELIGEIRDSREPHIAEYRMIDENNIIIPGSMEIDKFNEIMKTDIQTKEFATIAGYVTGFTGVIPREGEIITIGGLRFHILSAEPNRISKIKVEKT